jgi:polyisoprenoid-binding protein YceI
MNLFKTGLVATLLTATLFMFSCTNSGSTEVVEEEVVSEGVTGTFAISADNSELLWTGKKVTGKHFGNIEISEGQVELENGLVTAAGFTVDMTTLTVTDLEDEELNAKLRGHLFSDDFFSIETHPTATFVVTSAEGNTVTGDLTIKGITNPVSFPVTVTETEAGVVVSGTMKVDRTLYEVRYGSGKFFENLGDNMISDEFTLDFAIQL